MMNINNIKIFILSILIGSTPLYSQYLAKIGGIEISPESFKQRYEFTPKVKDASDSSKINFLYSLIAEKLMTLEAKTRSMDTIPYVLNSTLDIERKLVRDKLYKLEIENKVKVSDEEIAGDRFKVSQRRILNFLYSDDKLKIDNLFDQLNLGVPFDSLLQGRAERSDQPDGIAVIYGQMNANMENIIFNLRPKEYSYPIFVEGGWVIYRLIRIEEAALPKDNSEQAITKRLNDVIFARKAKNYYNIFYDTKIKGQNISVNNVLSERLSKNVVESLSLDEKKFFNKYKNEYEISGNEIIKLKKKFTKNELMSKFIFFQDSPVSFEQYLIHLELNGLFSLSISPEEVNQALNKNIKEYIFEEIVVREGYKMGLENSSDVRNDLQQWAQSFLASYYRYSLIDSIQINDDEAKKFYNRIIEQNDSLKNFSYDDVKEKIKEGLFFNDLQDVYIDKTVSLALKYGIDVNKQLLDQIEVSSIEMMVYRNLGFGGQITAVPYLQSFYSWKYWLPQSLKLKLP